MFELSRKCTFTPLFRADNVQRLTNILNLPLKTHPVFVGTNETLLAENSRCPLQPLFGIIRPKQATTESCMFGDDGAVVAHYRKNPRIILWIIIYY